MGGSSNPVVQLSLPSLTCYVTIDSSSRFTIMFANSIPYRKTIPIYVVASDFTSHIFIDEPDNINLSYHVKRHLIILVTDLHCHHDNFI